MDSLISWVAREVPRRAMRSDEEVAFKGDTVSGVDEFVVKVDATVCREGQIVQFLHQKGETLDASHMLERVHPWPYLVQLHTGSILHDDILRPAWVRWIITPIENLWYWDIGVFPD